MTEAPRRTIPWRRLAVEFVVIVVGVLVALAVDQWAQGREDEDTAREVLQALGSELESNRAQLDRRIEYHESVLPGLDSLQRVVESGPAANILSSEALPQGLGFAILRDTSWELALLTEAVHHIELGLAELLSITYSLQEELGDTEQSVRDGIVRPEWFGASDQTGAVIFLRVMLTDVLEQERSLRRLADAAIDAIRERLGDEYVGSSVEISLVPRDARVG